MATVEVRPNDDGTVDEVVLNGPGCWFHLEQMSDTAYWFAVEAGGVRRAFWLSVGKGKLICREES